MRQVSRADRPSFLSGTGELRVLISAQTVGAAHATMGHGKMEPGAVIPAAGEMSTHPSEEYSYVVRGAITVWVEGEERRLQAGDALLIPAGQRHIFRNEGDEPAEFIWFLSPGVDL
jgi:quercetin dioxygenase-like cupin family protein